LLRIVTNISYLHMFEPRYPDEQVALFHRFTNNTITSDRVEHSTYCYQSVRTSHTILVIK